MKTRIRPLLVSASGAIAVALLASSLTLGSSRSVRAEDGEALTAAQPDTILVSAKDLEGLEQRVSHLEELVESLTASSQHIKTRQLWVSDESGAETCVTKAQLDAFLANQAHPAEAAQPAPGAGAEGTPSAKEQTAAVPPGNSELPAAVVPAAVPTSNPEPSAAAGSNGISPAEPESTGAILTPTAPPAAAAIQTAPDSETVKAAAVQGSLSTPAAAAAAPPNAQPDSEAVKADELP